MIDSSDRDYDAGVDRDHPTSSHRIGVTRSAWRWWCGVAEMEGRLTATSRLLSALGEFVRESLPGRRRLRFGDADYDWEHRVNTTSGAVSWRDRLLGAFHSPYQPTEAALFHEMIAAFSRQPGFDFRDFTFIDLGSGKGRTLLMAADYPFRRIVGVELLPALHQVAQENLRLYRSGSRKCFSVASICADATEFCFPAEALVLYLFNPFPEAGLRRVIGNLLSSLLEHPRAVYVIYHNPLLEFVLAERSGWKKILGTLQYSVYGRACGRDKKICGANP